MLAHVGRRGGYLLFLTLLDLVVGYALLQPLPLGLSASQFYRPFVVIMPLAVWATAWICIGLLAGVAAFVKRLETPAFALAALLKTAWASGYLIGWLSDSPAFSRGYYSAAIWGAFAAVTLMVSSWRENGT